MVKVTLNDNLVPSRDPWVKGNPHSDLVYNYLLARKLIRTAQFIFQFRKGAAVYSGYINEFQAGSFKFRVYERGVPIRSIKLRGLGFAGQLSIDVEDFSQAVCQDVFGSLTPSSGMALAFVESPSGDRIVCEQV